MSSEYRPLITQSLESLDNHVEIFFAESRLACISTTQLAEVEEAQLMTLLVSFDPEPSQRWSARALAATFIAAQCEFRQLPIGHQLDSWLDTLLCDRTPASLCVVFSLPGYSTAISQQINNLLTSLRAANYHRLHFTVAVSSSFVDRGKCDGIDGFVMSETPHRGLAAVQVFGMLAALMAPGMSHCFDVEDLRPAFGSAEHPAQVASGVFHAEEFKISAEVLSKLEASSSVAFMPAAPMRMGAQHALLQSVRKLMRPESELVMMTPYAMQSIPLLMEEIIMVSLLMA